MAVAVVAEVSLALPPGPASYPETWVSVGLLTLTALSLLAQIRRLPKWADLAAPLLYTGSALALILAAGGSSAGVGLVVLLPIVWAALYLDLWKSFVVVVAVVAIEFVTTYTPTDLSDTVRLRREFAFLFVGALVVLSIYEIRVNYARSDRLRATREEEMSQTISEVFEQNRVTSILGTLVEMLNFCDVEDEAYEVFEFAARQLFLQGGCIAILNEEDGVMEIKCNWFDDDLSIEPFAPENCNSIEHLQPYESNAENPPCRHYRGNADSDTTLCYPLSIKREIVGILILSLPDDVVDAPFQSPSNYRQNARLIGDQFSIWLANFKLRESLRNLSNRDPLTNLFNRRFMIETLHREITMASRSDDQTSVVQIDIDHFKSFNDRFGHEVGDEVLCASPVDRAAKSSP
jgi:diguanylate cyclase with GGDEF domain